MKWSIRAVTLLQSHYIGRTDGDVTAAIDTLSVARLLSHSTIYRLYSHEPVFSVCSVSSVCRGMTGQCVGLLFPATPR